MAAWLRNTGGSLAAWEDRQPKPTVARFCWRTTTGSHRLNDECGHSSRPLTFDMRGGRKWAKPACGRPFDGRVRPRRGQGVIATSRREFMFVIKRVSARANRAGETSACISPAAKRAYATGTREAGACAEPAAWRCGTPQGQRNERMRHDRTNPDHLAVVFKLRFIEDSVLEDTQAYRLFQASLTFHAPESS
jgi:hypothetical protein